MSLARAFTKRMARRNNDVVSPTRSNTVKLASGTINRNMISLPTELISTTNVQALTAPDINNMSTSSSGASIHSNGNDSDFSTIDRSFLTHSDGSFIDSTPVTPITPTDDVKSFLDAKSSSFVTPALAPAANLSAPAIPQRAPSHSKRAHVELSRKRSIQRMSPPPMAISSKPSVRSSAELFNSNTDSNHPFGRELAQVHEVAEDFGATAALLDEEEREIMSKGLCKFGVEDYLDEIAGIYGGVFEDKLGPMANPWI